MADTKPRILYSNHLATYKDGLYATSEDTDQEVEKLANPKRSSYWQPTMAAMASAVYVYLFAAISQMLTNWIFLLWTNGTSAAPDGFTLSGASASVARVAGSVVGPYAAELTRAGADASLEQEYDDQIADYRGRQVAAGAWLTCSVADRARVSLTDGTTTWNSSYHTGGGTAEWLSIASGVIELDADELTVAVEINTGDTTCEIEGILLVPGATATETPHEITADAIGVAQHDLVSENITMSIETSTDNFTTDTSRHTVTPNADGDVLESFAASYSAAYWRIKLVKAGTYAGRPSIGVVFLGEVMEMPEYAWPGLDPLNEKVYSHGANNWAGQVQGTGIKRVYRKYALKFRYILRSFITGSYAAFWDSAGRNGLPFFVAHNEGTYPNEAHYVKLSPGAALSAPMAIASRIDTLTLPVEGYVE